ncbi:hypothetical protein [Shinella zoogloeoides]|nr:hypothetical protein [Shinella zoogloeoides]
MTSPSLPISPQAAAASASGIAALEWEAHLRVLDRIDRSDRQ